MKLASMTRAELAAVVLGAMVVSTDVLLALADRVDLSWWSGDEALAALALTMHRGHGRNAGERVLVVDAWLRARRVRPNDVLVPAALAYLEFPFITLARLEQMVERLSATEAT